MQKDTNTNFQLRTEFLKIYYLSVITGIASFSYKTNSKIKFNNIQLTRFIWPLIIIGANLFGCIYAYITSKHIKLTTLNLFVYQIVLPINFVSSIIIVFIFNSVKRRDFINLMSNFLDIEETVVIIDHTSRKICRFLKTFAKVSVIFVHIAYLIFESWYWGRYTHIYYETLARVSDVIQMILLIIFKSVVNVIQMQLDGILRRFSNDEVDNFGKNKKASLYHSRISSMKFSNTVLLKDIGRLRKEYFYVYTLTKKTNAVFSFTLLLIILKYSIYLVYSMYCTYLIITCNAQMCDGFDPLRIVTLLFWIIHVAASLYLITYSCNDVVLKVRQVADNVQKLMLQQEILSDDTEQLELFASQLTHNQIEFNAIAFNLNLTFFCTLMTSVCTYTIVVIQLK
ncbi:hypothetical protein L9F63_001331 [Diploptera punctata]|uniref:Gustatory receptor n=1 Tax=Diploptera punctata TaxID=6984 RepID=A0AAD8A642_DIPPU|nr:hypothetical protein L9F63_001331 [Diploptera punctata]